MGDVEEIHPVEGRAATAEKRNTLTTLLSHTQGMPNNSADKEEVSRAVE